MLLNRSIGVYLRKVYRMDQGAILQNVTKSNLVNRAFGYQFRIDHAVFAEYECLQVSKQDKSMSDDEIVVKENIFRSKYNVPEIETLENFVNSVRKKIQVDDEDLPKEFYKDVENLSRAFRNRSNHWTLFISKQKRYSRGSAKKRIIL